MKKGSQDVLVAVPRGGTRFCFSLVCALLGVIEASALPGSGSC